MLKLQVRVLLQQILSWELHYYWYWCKRLLYGSVLQRNCEEGIDMDHITFSVNAAFFVYLVLHAFVKMGTFLHLVAKAALSPCHCCWAHHSRPQKMNNQDQCDLTICCPYPTVLTAFWLKAVGLNAVRVHFIALKNLVCFLISTTGIGWWMPKLAQASPLFPALAFHKPWQGSARAWFLQCTLLFVISYLLKRHEREV